MQESNVVRVLDQIVEAINRRLNGAARVYSTSRDITEEKPGCPRLWVSPESWRPLGRCGGFRLDQHTITVTLQHRARIVQESVDLDHALLHTDWVREILQDWHYTWEDVVVGMTANQNVYANILDISGPFTVDKSKLASPGETVIEFKLDCDLLSGAVSEEETDDEKILTEARRAVWAAIDNWPAFAPEVEGEPTSIWARTYKTSADICELQLRDPAPWELPALAFYWDEIRPEWIVHRSQEWPMGIRMTAWFPGDAYGAAEKHVQDIIEALYQSERPETPGVPIVHNDTGYPPKRVGPLTVNSVELGRAGNVRAIRADTAFVLRGLHDPFGN